MSPDERLAMQAIERRVALENELERKRVELQMQRLEERQHPSRKIRMRNVFKELKTLQTMLPKHRR
jgi:hypothetical protein